MWNIEYKTFTDVDNLSLCLSHNLQQSLACIYMSFPGGSDGKESACNERDPSLDLEDPLATHSSILAWEIPGTEEPGGVQSIAVSESDKTERLTHTHMWVYTFVYILYLWEVLEYLSILDEWIGEAQTKNWQKLSMRNNYAPTWRKKV